MTYLGIGTSSCATTSGVGGSTEPAAVPEALEVPRPSRNDRTLLTDQAEPVRNRQIWTVQAIDPAGNVTASDPRRGTLTLPSSYVAEHVELGWAVTGYGNQGDTVDIGIAILEPGTTRNHTYVALTRGREANHAWIPDPTGLVDPTQHLERLIAQEPRRQSALAIQHELHLAAGLHTPPVLEPPGLDRSR